MDIERKTQGALMVKRIRNEFYRFGLFECSAPAVENIRVGGKQFRLSGICARNFPETFICS